MNDSTVLMGGGCLALGVLLGILASQWLLRRRTSGKVRLPGHWPLRLRRMVNANEKVVWNWLRQTFPEHVVMVKVPISRFTMLVEAKENTKASADRSSDEQVAADAAQRGDKWIDLLNTVYSSFVVCTTSGRVVGCVDVAGNSTLTKGNRDLKEQLFLDSGVAYSVVNPISLPDIASIRFAFLGEQQAMPVELEVTHGGDSIFREELGAFAKIPGVVIR